MSHNQGCTTNGQCGRDNVNLQEARPTPTAMASRLVAIAVVTVTRNRVDGAVLHLHHLRHENFNNHSPAEKYQQHKRNPVVHSRTNRLANMPIPQPISGVRFRRHQK